MAAVMIESPGIGAGPCVECKHIDCEATRQDADKPCAICGKRIGYDTRFFMDATGKPGEWRWTHMVCRIREIETGK